MIKEKGRKWSKIAKEFGNRTEHAVKNRYNQLMSKYERDIRSSKNREESETEQDMLSYIQTELVKM